MRRPLPPDLVELGDHLEGAVRRSVGRRPTRRQMLLNAATSVLVALPFVPAVLQGIATPVTAAPTAIVQERAARAPGYGGARNDFPPRALRAPESAAGDALAEPTTLRRALR